MSTSEIYQPKYSVGYKYKVGNTDYFIEKIEDGMYYERCSSFIGYLVTRIDVFDANHGAGESVSLGIGLPTHAETENNNESS
jgi:hypothetical protein